MISVDTHVGRVNAIEATHFFGECSICFSPVRFLGPFELSAIAVSLEGDPDRGTLDIKKIRSEEFSVEVEMAP
jgi:hypothetical protein